VPPILVDTVVKVGGGLLAAPAYVDAALAAVAAAADRCRLLIVPGGGPFADAVRDADRRLGLADDAAHWMAVLAMDQYAHLLAARLGRCVLAANPDEIAAALRASRIPVLVPYGWLREADPLPHSWDVTSDSVAAWIAGRLGARRLVLINPPGATGGGMLDPYFARTLPTHVAAVSIPADQREALESALTG
jgi:aspartokinase-like uncharacterized kinase